MRGKADKYPGKDGNGISCYTKLGALMTMTESHESYSFAVTDEEEWLSHLELHGYCVIEKVVGSDIVALATDSLWRDMEGRFGAARDDISTWSMIPNGGAGILNQYLPQSEGAWLIRGQESIRSIFRRIWDTDDLLVSMDSLLVWLPWWVNSSWKPHTEGLHIDQNPFYKPTRCCVQGMFPLTDVTSEIGGLEVVPGSHLPESHEVFKANHSHYKRFPSDWCPVRTLNPADPPPVLLQARAGDLILWDSRLIHGGKVGTMPCCDFANTTAQEAESSPGLARLAVPVCMTPRAALAPRLAEAVLTRREQAYVQGWTTTHWPHDPHFTFKPQPTETAYSPASLPARVRALIS